MATLDPGDHAIVVGPYYATYPGVFRAAQWGVSQIPTQRPPSP